MKLNDTTSKDWLDAWLVVTIIFTILYTTSAILLGSWWGLEYSGFLIGLVLRIKYMKTDLFGLFEVLISIVFSIIWYTVILLIFVVPGVFVIAHHPNPEAISMILLYLGYIMCPILAGFLRQRFKKRN